MSVEWRKIPYLPDRYEVSSDGQVRVLAREVRCYRKGNYHLRKIPGKILKQRVDDYGKSRGWPVVNIHHAEGDRSVIGEMRVALMVCRAYHGCPYKPSDAKGAQFYRIRHKDGDVMNNAADNLEWAVRGKYGESLDMYESNIRKIEAARSEPADDWIKRMWGDEAGVA